MPMYRVRDVAPVEVGAIIKCNGHTALQCVQAAMQQGIHDIVQTGDPPTSGLQAAEILSQGSVIIVTVTPRTQPGRMVGEDRNGSGPS